MSASIKYNDSTIFNIASGQKVVLACKGIKMKSDLEIAASGGGGTSTNEGYDKGYQEGRQAEYNEFWDTFQSNGNRTNYEYAFADSYGSKWVKDKTYKPKYPLRPTYAPYMYYSTKLPYDCVAAVDFSQCTNFTQCFAYTALTRLGTIDMSKATNTKLAFTGNNSLTKIDKIIVSETTPFNNTFLDSKKLTDILFEGTLGQNGLNLGQATSLSKESIISVVNILSTTTSGLSITLSRTAVDNAFAVGNTIGSETSDWGELINTRSNWTISLV